MTCPEGDVLIALSDGELGEKRARAVRSHVDQCSRCRAELAELSTIAGDLRAPIPGALGGKSAESFADDVLAELDRPRAVPASRWTRWAMMLAAAAALPLAATAAVHWTRPSETWTARGAEISPVKRTALRFGRVTESFEPIAEGAVVEADALLAAEVAGTEGAPRFLLAFLVDAAGERHWIYPVYEPGAQPPSSVVLPVTAGPRVLGSMVRLDHPAPGPATLVAIVLSRSETVEHVERAPLEQLSRERLGAHYEGSLVVTTRVEIRP
ncbi:MAG: zf-HC2 domain-containing protein [Labilithrix sp.]|nr:zf-HC2 domain-containing protein [Labilithrix sp.]